MNRSIGALAPKETSTKRDASFPCRICQTRAVPGPLFRNFIANKELGTLFQWRWRRRAQLARTKKGQRFWVLLQAETEITREPRPAQAEKNCVGTRFR
jgi:hypothetical protein